MNNIDKELMLLVNEYAEEYDVEAVLEEVLGGMTIGEIVVEMYNAGLISDRQIAIFLEVDADDSN